MSQTSHTPGPWTARNSASGCSDMRDDMFDWSSPVECFAPYPEAEDSDLAGETVDEQVVAHGRGRTASEAMANARLIAAAPDLLAIAERWAALDGGAWNVERHAREKAELLSVTRAAIAKATGEA